MFSLSNPTHGRKYVVWIHNPCVILLSKIKLNSKRERWMGHVLFAGLHMDTLRNLTMLFFFGKNTAEGCFRTSIHFVIWNFDSEFSHPSYSL